MARYAGFKCRSLKSYSFLEQDQKRLSCVPSSGIFAMNALAI